MYTVLFLRFRILKEKGLQIGQRLAVAIIPEQCTSDVLNAITSSGIRRVMSFSARGTAELALLQKLGLGQTQKSLIAFMHEDGSSRSCDILQRSIQNRDGNTGFFFSLHMEKNEVSDKTDHLLVCVIVNSGYAEAVMQEARKAGARGGTIINARGTGKEQDMDFFGIQIVPEKEMLVMVAERELAEKLVEVVKAHPLLSKPGSGLVFTVAADSCTRLGGTTT